MKKKKNKKRLDVLLFEKGFAETRTKAQAFIMSGNIFVNNQIQYRPGTLVGKEDSIEVRNANPYVSRGGLKLESVLETLAIDLEGYICLDIGASTGGFTDCMLQKGAIKVYAVDVGAGQLHYRLRQDKRVVNIENVNFRYFDNSFLKDNIDFTTIDVSFISLDKILPVAYRSISKNGFVLAMIKPQFELEASEIKKGVVRDKKLRQKAINKIKKVALDLGFKIISEADSCLKGLRGNLEHFIFLSKKHIFF
ncbi:TlyA family RNA methyltransferase [Candidatus Endomicrobiellum trichonymphae]|uniref:Predicted rRNA methyltransferase YqxC n=1 Tax=Endomicrobium trichonymphae TaxID=1408204 RepID=B1GZX8_ENDTX|nr:TlyA family RNA methyltransferase [Candidatus Endomicrobium trichonymphae]BAG13810.1 predicted rRNA methyltransferase YqxC [Candidatus Endomicrobium trichonymphae]